MSTLQEIKRNFFLYLILIFFHSSAAGSGIKIHKIDAVSLPELRVTVSVEENGVVLSSIDASKIQAQIDETSIFQADGVYPSTETNEGLWIVLNIDISGSMRGKLIETIKDAIINILIEKGSKDRMALVTFHDDVFVNSNFSQDVDIISKQLDRIKTGGTKTALYKSLSVCLDLFSETEDADGRYLVVFSDGKNEDEGYSLDDAILKANDISVPVYSIGFVSSVEEHYLDSLKYLAQKTDGEFRKAISVEDISEAYKRVSGTILNKHNVSFNTGISQDGNTHTLEVSYKCSDGSVANASITFKAPLDSMGMKGAIYEPGKVSHEEESRFAGIRFFYIGIPTIAIILLVIYLRIRRKHKNLCLFSLALDRRKGKREGEKIEGGYEEAASQNIEQSPEEKKKDFPRAEEIQQEAKSEKIIEKMDDQIENWLGIELPPEEEKDIPQADKIQPEVKSKQLLESKSDQSVKIPGIEQPPEDIYRLQGHYEQAYEIYSKLVESEKEEHELKRKLEEVTSHLGGDSQAVEKPVEHSEPERKSSTDVADKSQPEVKSKQPLESRFDQIVKISGIEQPPEEEKDSPRAEEKHPEARSKQRTEMVITVGGLKGGTGKSTIALNLAGALSTGNRKVLLIDVDSQGSVAEWQKISKQKEPSIAVEPASEVHRKFDVVLDKFEAIIIDTPPATAYQTRSAIIASDLVIIPIVPGILDLWSLKKFLQFYLQVKEVNPSVEAFFLISRIDKRTNLGKELRPFLEKLDIPTLNTEIAQRISYSESFLAGKTIDQYAPKTQAAETFQQLKREILSWQTKRLGKLEAGLNQ